VSIGPKRVNASENLGEAPPLMSHTTTSGQDQFKILETSDINYKILQKKFLFLKTYRIGITYFGSLIKESRRHNRKSNRKPYDFRVIILCPHPHETIQYNNRNHSGSLGSLIKSSKRTQKNSDRNRYVFFLSLDGIIMFEINISTCHL
jgi:hypothetical protein